MGYTIVRYTAFGPFFWIKSPLYLLDKGVAFAALNYLVISFLLSIFKINYRKSNRLFLLPKYLGITGLVFVITHIAMSFFVLNATNFPTYYLGNNSFSFIGILILSAGVASSIFFCLHHLSYNNRVFKSNKLTNVLFSKQNLVIAFVLVGTHVFFMGYKGWLFPQTWHGNLPPITLISCTFLIMALGVKYLKTKI